MAGATATESYQEAEEDKEDAFDSGVEERTSSGKRKVVRKRRMPQLTINLINCKYDSVRRVAKRFGIKVVREDEEWSIYWTDVELPDKLNEIKPYQKVNHFPGMNEICRKDLLARNMNRMLKLFPKDYNCFPRTWTLPADFGDFQAYCQKKKNKIFIAKPGSGSQGKGIFLFRSPKEVNNGEHLVCQQYIARPFIIDGFKFDLRLYVLVTSCDPLRVYMYRDGLARFATIQYKEPTGHNMDEACMHLTNYAINKLSKDFIRDDDSGSKRRVTTVNKWFIENGYDIDKIWGAINDVVIKTLIAIHPILKHNYRSFFYNHTRGSACFEILGFDILLDRKLKAWLVEVNRSPSFHTDAPLDKEVKEGLLHDTFQLLDLFSNSKKRCQEQEKKKAQDRLLCGKKSKENSAHEEEERAQYAAHFEKYEQRHLGGFTRIYPKDGNEEVYKNFFDQSTSLCSQTASSRARSEIAKQLREELEVKRKEQKGFLSKDKPLRQSKSESSGAESPPHMREQRMKLIASQVEASKRLSSAGHSAVVRRRGMSFRVPALQLTEDESLLLTGELPEMIQEEEELERLAGLQLRESLVRGMGVSEQVRVALESQPSSRAVTPSGPPVRANCESAENPHYFTQTYLHQDLPEHLPSSHSAHLLPGHTLNWPPRGGPNGSTVINRGVPEYRLQQLQSPYQLQFHTPPPSLLPPNIITPQWNNPTHYKYPSTTTNPFYKDRGNAAQLELCGSAIPPAPPRPKQRLIYRQTQLSTARRQHSMAATHRHHSLSINDRLRQLKFNLSAPPIRR